MREKVTLGKIWGIIYPELLYTLITNIFVFFVTMVMTVLLMINGDYNSPDEIVKVLVGGINSQVMMITLWSAVVTLPFLIMFRRADIRHDKLNDRHVKYESVFPLKYLLIIPFGIFCMLAANSFVELLVMAVPGLMTDSYKAVEQSIYGSSFEIQVLAAGIICPIVEEMIYRALVYNRVKKLAGGVVAAVLSAVIFGVSHGNMIQGIYAFFIGLVCVYVYEKYKSIVAPIFLHISANMFSLILSAFSTGVSENTTVDVSQVDMIITFIVMTVITGVITLFIGIIINKIVNPKESI